MNDGKLKVVDINKKQSEVEVKELKSLSQVVEGLKEKFPGLVHWRVPVCNSAAPLETDFDIMIQTLAGTGINLSVLKTDKYQMDMTKDALFRGEFEVVKELVEKMKDGVAAKNNADKIIDLNGTKKTGGTGIKQLREN